MVEAETDESKAWLGFVRAAAEWSRHMDQFERVKFIHPEGPEYGPVYLTISLSDSYPESFEVVDVETGKTSPGWGRPLSTGKPSRTRGSKADV